MTNLKELAHLLEAVGKEMLGINTLLSGKFGVWTGSEGAGSLIGPNSSIYFLQVL